MSAKVINDTSGIFKATFQGLSFPCRRRWWGYYLKGAWCPEWLQGAEPLYGPAANYDIIINVYFIKQPITAYLGSYTT